MKIIFYLLPILALCLQPGLAPWRNASASGWSAGFYAPAGAVLYVKPGAVGNCHSWAAACELQTALGAAVSGDEIWVRQGVYKPTAGADQTATFTLKNGVAVYGGFAGTETARGQRDPATNVTTLSGDIGVPANKGDNSLHVVSANSGVDGSAVLDGFSVEYGNADGGAFPDNYGGGMFNYGNSSPTLANLTFANNVAAYGGGMYNYHGSPTLTNVTFLHNVATDSGGGLRSEQNNSPSLTNVTFYSNTADVNGGGLFNSGGARLTNVTFYENAALSSGGGMYNYDVSYANLTNVTFLNNTAVDGGAMFNEDCSPTVTNVSLVNNVAHGHGGGVNNSVFSSPILSNAILWGNTPDQIYNYYYSTPTVSYSDIHGGYIGTGNLNVDPLLVDAAGGNLRLQRTSPVIDAGKNAAVPGGVTTDLDGSPRFVDVPGVANTGSGTPPLVDMGAYEAQLSRPIIYVDHDAPGPVHDGSAWGKAFLGLQSGLAAAAAGNEIWVADGIYYPGQAGNRLATFQLKHSVAVYGGFAGTETARGQRNPASHVTILSGDLDHNGTRDNGNAYHVVVCPLAVQCAVLDGFTVEQGNANGGSPSDQGGGMYGDVSSGVSLANVTFTNNAALYGGGMASNLNGTFTLTNVTFTHNAASGYGGGLSTDLSISPTLTNVTFADNTATASGGGLFNGGSYSLALTQVTFANNMAGVGGGLYNQDNGDPTQQNVTLTDVIFTHNQTTGGSGGGMASVGENPTPLVMTLVNVIFSHNTTGAGGGGMYTELSTPTLINVTFANNTAGTVGGAMANQNTISATVTNAILWGSTPDQIYANDAGSTPVVSYSDIQGGYSGTGNIAVDPRFVDAAAGNVRLRPNSPAIDAGNNAAVPGGVTTDLDGHPRFVNVPGVVDTGQGTPPLVDMGAYEVQIMVYLPLVFR